MYISRSETNLVNSSNTNCNWQQKDLPNLLGTIKSKFSHLLYTWRLSMPFSLLRSKTDTKFNKQTSRVLTLMVFEGEGLYETPRRLQCHEWNHKLDSKLKNLGYTRLYSDPCAYIRCDGHNASIITVWVDDLLVFTSGDNLMPKMQYFSVPHRFLQDSKDSWRFLRIPEDS